MGKGMIFSSVTETAEAIRRKSVSSREVIELYIDRIDKVNPKLNSVVQIDRENAIRQAVSADRDLALGRVHGPLHGIPMTIKDSFDTKDMISSGGTLGRKSFVPAKDATVVSRLRDAGAILLGKTNTSEFTLTYETDNLVYGRTNNPYDFSRTPGGSSGGAAATVAAGGSPFDIGSDYGGSLRYPAHCCGVATIKPTSGRVPRTGHILPFGGMLDSFQQVGPIARNVCDLQLLLSIISGPDGCDPSIVPMPLKDYRNADIGSLRVSFHTDNGILPASDETSDIVRKAAAILDEAGLKVKEDKPSGIEETYEIAMGLFAADGGASIERLLKESNTKEHTIPWLGLGQATDAKSLDALIMRWYRFRSTMLSYMKNCDVILCPVNASPAQPHGSLGQDLRAFSYTLTYNLTGWPAAVIPAGKSSEGLPIGLQIIGNPWQEERVLAVASFLEKELEAIPLPDSF